MALTAFLHIVEDLISRYGKNILWEKNFSNLLHDWIKGEFKNEAALFLLAIESGIAKQISDTQNIPQKKLYYLAEQFSQKYFVRHEQARKMVQLLALLIHQKKVYLDIDEQMYTRWRKQKPAGEDAPEAGMISFAESAFINDNGKITPLASYSIMQRPVTQAEYWTITGDNPSYTQGAALPVEGVHWYAAADFCNQKSARENIQSAYTIDKLVPDPDNFSPHDFLRWKVEAVPGAKGWRLPIAAEWVHAYKTSPLFFLSAGLMEWCWDFCGNLVENKIYTTDRVCFSLNKQGRIEKRSEGAVGMGCCLNVNSKQTNYDKPCFSYPGNYGFRLARSGK